MKGRAKKWLVLGVLILSASMILASCQNADDRLTQEDVKPQASNRTHKKLTIALVMKTLTNPFFIEMEKGARRAESEFDIELLVRTGAKETSIQQQIQIVEELILQKVDAIVIAPGSSTDLVKVLKKAQDAHIAIVNVDNQLDKVTCKKEGLSNVPFISVKNEQAAYLSVKQICATQDTTPRQAMIFEGIRDAENAKQRKAGAERAFNETPGVRIVASETANWKIDEAYELSKTLFKKHPYVELVFCANDMMALGVIQYLKENNLRGIKVAGFDDLADAQTAITEGWMQVTIDQQAGEQGYTGIRTAIQLIRGQEVANEVYIPVKVITKDILSK